MLKTTEWYVRLVWVNHMACELHLSKVAVHQERTRSQAAETLRALPLPAPPSPSGSSGWTVEEAGLSSPGV